MDGVASASAYVNVGAGSLGEEIENETYGGAVRGDGGGKSDRESAIFVAVIWCL